MKKNGFTLAEVLITLAIIGVVATLTLPALMNNTSEQQYKAAFKKGLNTLTIAAETNNAIDGYDFSGVNENSAAGATEASEHTSLYSLLASRGAVDYALSGLGSVGKMPAAAKGATYTQNFCVFFRDGSVLMFPNNALGTDKNGSGKIESDGLPYGIKAVYDVNGPKLPNLLSNCKHETALTSEGSEDVKNTSNAELSTTCSKANRVIKDRFGIRLRGHYAVPNGAAARWANDN